MSILDDVLALKPEERQAIFAALAPELAAENFARAIDAQVRQVQQAAYDEINALVTEASNRKASFDGTQTLFTSEELATTQAAIGVKLGAVGTVQTKIG